MGDKYCQIKIRKNPINQLCYISNDISHSCEISLQCINALEKQFVKHVALKCQIISRGTTSFPCSFYVFKSSRFMDRP